MCGCVGVCVCIARVTKSSGRDDKVFFFFSKCAKGQAVVNFLDFPAFPGGKEKVEYKIEKILLSLSLFPITEEGEEEEAPLRVIAFYSPFAHFIALFLSLFPLSPLSFSHG